MECRSFHLVAPHARLPPCGFTQQFPHFREQNGRTYEEGAECTHRTPFKWIFYELPLDTFTYPLEPELHRLVYLAAREAEKCSLNAIWLYVPLKIGGSMLLPWNKGMVDTGDGQWFLQH